MCSIQICVGYEECGYSTMGFTLETPTNLPLYLVDLKLDESMPGAGFFTAALSLKCLRPDPSVMNHITGSLESSQFNKAGTSDSGRFSHVNAQETASMISS